MRVVKRARQPYPERWPTKRELVRDVMRSPLLVGTCALAVGVGLGVSGSLQAQGAPEAWQPAAFALILVAVLVGGCRFVLEAFYEQELKPRAAEDEWRYGPVLSGDA